MRSDPARNLCPVVEQTGYALAAPRERHARAGLSARQALGRLEGEARRRAAARVQAYFLGRGVHNDSRLLVDGEPRRFSWPESINARPGDFISAEQLGQDFAVLAQLGVPQDGVIADVGANIGGKSFAYALWTGGAGRVFAFEPFGSTYDFLRRNMEDNGFAHVRALNQGLSDRAGPRFMGQPAPHQHQRYGGPLIEAGLFSVHADAQGAPPERGARQDFTTLDLFAEGESLSRLDFVKIDVEGHELSVLRGALGTLSRLRPALQLEMNSFALGLAGTDPREILELLRTLGYALFVEDGGKIEPFDEAVLTDGRYGQGDLIPYMFELVARPL